jgi:nucleoside 2-deoxyribosyltransferase
MHIDNSKMKLVKLTICGPRDVAKEIALVNEVVDEWNCQHGEEMGFWVKHQHWSTDTYPDAKETAQGAINKQIIDKTDVLVAIFWTRLGSPTDAAQSGTAEEIQRAIARGKKVLVYFSDLEAPLLGTNTAQAERLWSFRQQLRGASSCWTFRSRSQFRDDFANHLALLLNTFKHRKRSAAHPKKVPVTITQTSKGTGNIQIAGHGNLIHQYQRAPETKVVIERRPGSITPEEERQVAEWVSELAEGTIGKTRKEAFGEWSTRFLKRFGVTKRESLLSTQMPEVEKWYRQQRAIQKSGYKAKAPDQWRASRIKAIKAAMTSTGKTNETYYPELSDRLNMKRAFTSLTKLTRTDLDRVYHMVLRDRQQ